MGEKRVENILNQNTVNVEYLERERQNNNSAGCVKKCKHVKKCFSKKSFLNLWFFIRNKIEKKDFFYYDYYY
jgi:hypothetical protein